MELIFRETRFEQEVRERLGVFGRPLTEKDALLVTELDLSGFDFLQEDLDTLAHFVNLISLAIEIRQPSPAFWSRFVHMEELNMVCWGADVDFSMFAAMEQLSDLFVSGGDYSGINYLNLHALTPLKKLRRLVLHEFGGVDLAPLASMPQLRDFSLCYAKRVTNVETIGVLTWLTELHLVDLCVDDLDFLDSLPDCLELELCGIHVLEDIDPRKWRRFANRDISEISVKDLFRYTDLSVLDK